MKVIYVLLCALAISAGFTIKNVSMNMMGRAGYTMTYEKVNDEEPLNRPLPIFSVSKNQQSFVPSFLDWKGEGSVVVPDDWSYQTPKYCPNITDYENEGNTGE